MELRECWRLGGLSLRDLTVRTVKGFRENQLDARSAQFAYYSMLALAPLLILTIGGVAQLPLSGVLKSFLNAVGAGLPHNVVELIERQIEDIQASSTLGLFGLGFLLLSVAGSRVFLTLGAGLDAAYGVERRRRYLKARAVALAMTFGVFLLLLVAMILLVLGPMAADALLGRFGLKWLDVLLSAGMRWGVACGFMLLAASVLYWLVPSRRVRWYVVSPGSAFATVGWVAAMQGMRYYVEGIAQARYNETYGALGGVVVLLVWLYLTGALLLLGGQINGEILRAAEARDAKAE